MSELLFKNAEFRGRAPAKRLGFNAASATVRHHDGDEKVSNPGDPFANGPDDQGIWGATAPACCRIVGQRHTSRIRDLLHRIGTASNVYPFASAQLVVSILDARHAIKMAKALLSLPFSAVKL